MINRRNRYPARRRFLKQTAALSAGAATFAAPALALGGTVQADAAPEQAASARDIGAGGGVAPGADGRSTARSPKPCGNR